MNVFISYAREDAEQVRLIYLLLQLAGYRPWMDTEDLLPGRDWKMTIEQEIERADFVILCMSTNSIDKAGYVQAEMRQAIEAAKRMPRNQIFLLPVQLDKCETPWDLRDINYVPLDEPGGLGKLFNAIEVGRKERGLLSDVEKSTLGLLGWVARLGQTIVLQNGGLEFEFEGVLIRCYFDPYADRMRFVAGPLGQSKVGKKLSQQLLRANYGSTFDGKWGTENGEVFAAFLHPLSSLTELQCLRGLECCAGMMSSDRSDCGVAKPTAYSHQRLSKKPLGTTIDDVLGWLAELGPVESSPFVHDFQYKGRQMRLTSRVDDNSLAIESLIDAEVNDESLSQMLDANFHRVLDARYGLTENHPVAGFHHSLSELSCDLTLSGIEHVFQAAESYGSGFSSGPWEFRGMS